MPVRIYDISKRLGLDNKVVLAKAKELGITVARVPSSSLDKITAEFLEQQLGGKPVEVAAPRPPPPSQPIVVVTEPLPVVQPEPPKVDSAPTAIVETEAK